MNDNRQDMIDWLVCHGVTADQTKLKGKLLRLIYYNKAITPLYHIDELVKSYGHEAFHPIEIIWSF